MEKKIEILSDWTNFLNKIKIQQLVFFLEKGELLKNDVKLVLQRPNKTKSFSKCSQFKILVVKFTHIYILYTVLVIFFKYMNKKKRKNHFNYTLKTNNFLIFLVWSVIFFYSFWIIETFSSCKIFGIQTKKWTSITIWKITWFNWNKYNYDFNLNILWNWFFIQIKWCLKVELALRSDPNNDELLKLKVDLEVKFHNFHLFFLITN